MALDLLIRLVAQDNASSAIQNARRRTEELRAALEAARNSGSIEAIDEATRELDDHLNSAAGRAGALNETFEGMRNKGAAIAAVGAGITLLTRELTQAAIEGQKADAMLQAMMEKRGDGGRFEELADWAGQLAQDAALVDDDPIKEAAAGLYGFGLNADQVMKIMPGLIGQSRLYGQELSSVTEAFGRAFASGNAGALKRSGVTLSEADLDYIKAATSEVEKQERMFERVKLSMDRYALSITEGMTEGEIAANRLALEMDNAMTNLGKGTSRAQADVETLLGRILALTNTGPEIQEAGGYFLAWGGYTATAIGGVLTLTGQIGMTTLALQGMGVTATGAWAAVTAGAVTAGTAIWGAIAPLLPLVLAIAAVMAAITAGAVYLQKRAQAESETKSLEADRKDYDTFVSEGKFDKEGVNNRGRPRQGESFDDWWNRTRAGDYQNDDDGAGDINAALENAQKLANGQMSVPTMPSAPGTPAVAAVGLAIGDGDAETASAAATSKDAKKAAKDAIKATAKAEKAAAKTLKDMQRAKEKEAAALAKLEEKKSDKAAAIEIAQMEADIDLKVAQLEAQKGKGDNSAISQQIAQLNASKSLRAAEIRARADGNDSGALDVARIRYDSQMQQAALARGGAGGGNPIAAAIAGVMAGGGLPGSGGGRVSSGGGSGGASGGGSVMVGQPTYRQDAQGTWWVKFPDLRLPPDNYRRDALAYAR